MDKVSPTESQLSILLGIKVKEGLDVRRLLQKRGRERTPAGSLLMASPPPGGTGYKGATEECRLLHVSRDNLPSPPPTPFILSGSMWEQGMFTTAHNMLERARAHPAMAASAPHHGSKRCLSGKELGKQQSGSGLQSQALKRLQFPLVYCL